jgi:hypothetical protein
VLEVANGELRGWSPSEHRAAVIDVLGHSGLGCPDRAEPAGPTVNVLVRGNELRGERATCVSNFGSQHRYREPKFADASLSQWADRCQLSQGT